MPSYSGVVTVAVLVIDASMPSIATQLPAQAYETWILKRPPACKIQSFDARATTTSSSSSRL